MPVDTHTPSSRRAILAGAIGAAVASIASALGRPSAASAVATPVYLDQNNPSSAETSIETSAVINHAFIGSHLGNGTGVYGYSNGGNGVYGQTVGGTAAGVSGNASAGSGVNHGVYGQSASTSGRGVTGRALPGTGTTFGVHGQSDSSSGFGVYGYAAAGSGETIGAMGQAASQSGTGVYGLASSTQPIPTMGVRGRSESSIGLGGFFEGGDLGIDAYAFSAGATAGVRGTGSGQFTSGVVGFAEGSGAAGITGIAAAPSGPTMGVWGYTFSPDGSGVVGQGIGETGATRGVLGYVGSPGGTGVQGYSGAGDPPAPVAKTGVYGRATQDANARGVYGYSTSGQGVRGTATTGTAGYFNTPVVGPIHTGYALRAVGRVKFDKCAGVATVPVAANTVVVTPGVDLVSSSAVVATLLGSAGPATTTVSRVAVNATTNTFTIVLTANNTAANPVKVAWIVLG